MGGGVFVLGVFVGESIIEGFKQECFIIGTGIRCRNNSSSEVPRVIDFFRYQLDPADSFHQLARLDCPDTP